MLCILSVHGTVIYSCSYKLQVTFLIIVHWFMKRSLHHIWGQISSKLGHWKELPWLLCPDLMNNIFTLDIDSDKYFCLPVLAFCYFTIWFVITMRQAWCNVRVNWQHKVHRNNVVYQDTVTGTRGPLPICFVLYIMLVDNISGNQDFDLTWHQQKL